MNVCGLLKDILVGLLTGVIASAVYEYLSSQRQERKLKKHYEPFAGKYDEIHRPSGAAPSKTGGVIELKYLGRKRFSTVATNSEGAQEWKGEFGFLESEILATGYYCYISQDDVGLQRIVYVSRLEQFDVSGNNESNPNGAKDYKMIWKRQVAPSAAVTRP